MIWLEKYDHVALLLDAALIPRDHRIRDSVSKDKVLYLLDVV